MTPPWITEPGRYPELDERAYHADPVVGGSLSSSGSRALVERTPAHFAYERQHGRAPKEAFDIGHVTHTLVLGVGGELVEIDAPDWKTKNAREQRDAARAAGQTPVLVHQADRVRVMVDAVRTHSIAGPLFARTDAVAEHSFVARDPESGIMCRARPDWLAEPGGGQRLIVADLKTTDDASPRAFAKSMADWGYHQQDPFYCDVLHWLGLTADADGEPIEPLFLLVAVEKAPPHLVMVGRPEAEDRDRGRVKNRAGRDRFRAGQVTGQWPGYEPRIHDLALPGWARTQHDVAEADGRFDTEADRAEHLGVDGGLVEDSPAGPDTAEPAAAEPMTDLLTALRASIKAASPAPEPEQVTAPVLAGPAVQVEQVWIHKREPWRRLTVTALEGDYVHVERSTSRRRQPVRLSTLHRTYRLETP